MRVGNDIFLCAREWEIESLEKKKKGKSPGVCPGGMVTRRVDLQVFQDTMTRNVATFLTLLAHKKFS